LIVIAAFSATPFVSSVVAEAAGAPAMEVTAIANATEAIIRRCFICVSPLVPAGRPI
jgi:hypothetical protein